MTNLQEKSLPSETSPIIQHLLSPIFTYISISQYVLQEKNYCNVIFFQYCAALILNVVILINSMFLAVSGGALFGDEPVVAAQHPQYCAQLGVF